MAALEHFTSKFSKFFWYGRESHDRRIMKDFERQMLIEFKQIKTKQWEILCKLAMNHIRVFFFINKIKFLKFDRHK